MFDAPQPDPKARPVARPVDNPCRICGHQPLQKIIDLGALPIAHRLLTSPEEAEPVFPMAAHLCPQCGLVQIIDPIAPDLLYRSFNYNFSSWKPEPHLQDELEAIFSHIAPTSAFEIGCNDGRFLSELRQRGVKTVVGIEPNPVSGGRARQKGIDLLPGMASPALAAEAVGKYGRFPLAVARQVLEHILDLEPFFACIHEALADDGLLFIDVPNLEPGLRQGDCSVLWEEHVNYFTEPVLIHLLARQGFEPLSVHKYDFSGGTLAVLARRAAPAGPVPRTAIPTEAPAFGTRVRAYGERLRAALERVRRQGAAVVLYGVGCRACTVTNGLQLAPLIDYAVDDQSERQGKFMPGSRLVIYPSQSLNEMKKPVVCLLAVNHENEEKVMRRFAVLKHDRIRFVSLFAPMDIHGELNRLENCTMSQVGLMGTGSVRFLR